LFALQAKILQVENSYTYWRWFYKNSMFNFFLRIWCPQQYYRKASWQPYKFLPSSPFTFGAFNTSHLAHVHDNHTGRCLDSCLDCHLLFVEKL